jgi:hypothetical protein
MENSTYIRRATTHIAKGFRTGGVFMAASIIIVAFLITLLRYSADPFSDRFVFALVLPLLIIIPFSIIFLLDIALNGLILAFQKDSHLNPVSIFLGLLIPIMLIGTFDYLAYMMSLPPSKGYDVSFLAYLFPDNILPAWTILFCNEYLAPSILSIILLTYVNWKTISFPQNGEIPSKIKIAVSALIFLAICSILAIIPLALLGIHFEDSVFLGIYAFAFIICSISAIIFLSKKILKFIFAHSKSVTSKIVAVFWGLVVGFGLTLIFNFILWAITHSDFSYNANVSFSSFLLPQGFNSIYKFLFETNPFFIPSILTILISAYMGWETYKEIILPKE